MADDKTPYHERYKAAPPPDYMRYLTAPFTGYWERQERLAREASAIADDGITRARQGDLSGYLGMFLGPAGYVASPINALFPTDAEIYSSGLPDWVKPGAAGVLGTAAIMAPGPKGLGVVDDLADAAPVTRTLDQAKSMGGGAAREVASAEELAAQAALQQRIAQPFTAQDIAAKALAGDATKAQALAFLKSASRNPRYTPEALAEAAQIIEGSAISKHARESAPDVDRPIVRTTHQFKSMGGKD